MLSRDVVSLRIGLRGLAELGEGLGVVAVGEVEQPGGAVGDGAVRARVERLLGEQRGGLLLALRQVRERELGERRGVGRLAHEHLARLGDGLVDLPALAQRGDVRARARRPRWDGPARSPRAPRPRPSARRGAADLGQRLGDALLVGRRAWRRSTAASSAPARSPALGERRRRDRSAPPRGSSRCEIASRERAIARVARPVLRRLRRPAPSSPRRRVCRRQRDGGGPARGRRFPPHAASARWLSARGSERPRMPATSVRSLQASGLSDRQRAVELTSSPAWARGGHGATRAPR